MKRIKLSQGKFCLVNDTDFDWLNQWKWTFDRGYARRNENGKKIYMHNLINQTPTGYVTDHLDRNPLNNQRNNLRIATKSENSFNAGLWKHNKSGYRGVSWSKSAKKWLSRIQIGNKVIHLGLFVDIYDAVKAREAFEINNLILHTK